MGVLRSDLPTGHQLSISLATRRGTTAVPTTATTPPTSGTSETHKATRARWLVLSCYGSPIDIRLVATGVASHNGYTTICRITGYSSFRTSALSISAGEKTSIKPSEVISNPRGRCSVTGYRREVTLPICTPISLSLRSADQPFCRRKLSGRSGRSCYRGVVSARSCFSPIRESGIKSKDYTLKSAGYHR